MLLSGEAGIGKTHLVAGLVHRVAGEGHAVLVGRCAAAAMAYGPLAEALRGSGEVRGVMDAAPVAVVDALAPLLDDPVDPSGDAGPAGSAPAAPGSREVTVASAFSVVLRRLAADTPVLLVVEGAERIDPSSALLLGHLVERLPAGCARRRLLPGPAGWAASAPAPAGRRHGIPRPDRTGRPRPPR